MSQTKQQNKTPEKQLSEVKIGNLLEKEFRIMIVKMIQDPGKQWGQGSRRCIKMFNIDLEELKTKQAEMNNKITEIKNTLEGINRIS